MGTCISTAMNGGAQPHLLGADQVDGTDKEYHNRFIEDDATILGEGEFGQVKMVYDITNTTATSGGEHGDQNQQNIPYACKVLHKGIQIKDNVLYTPMKPTVLKQEVGILRALNGQKYCLKLMGVYESSRQVYVVTEYCDGGDMMQYLSKAYHHHHQYSEDDSSSKDLTTEDVSRIAYQLLSAVDHCATHKIIHRDIKPENVMFLNPDPGSELRLIDFGSGCWDAQPQPQPHQKSDMTDNTASSSSSSKDGAADHHHRKTIRDSKGTELEVHTTYAGTGFYISPEMFQHSYTRETDVWSVGVTLYVLVAGYPADNLQKAFDLLQSNSRDLKKLPNMPQNLPNSYYELLDGLLTYRHKKRPSAGEMLQQNEFVQLHNKQRVAGGEIEEQEKEKEKRVQNPLSGTVGRHTVALGYKSFELHLTTALVTCLSDEELQQFMSFVEEECISIAASADGDDDEANSGDIDGGDEGPSSIILDDISNKGEGNNKSLVETNGDREQKKKKKKKKLDVIPVCDLKRILKDKLQAELAISAIEGLTNEHLYGNYAYHLKLLKEMQAAAASANKNRKGGGGRRDPKSRGSFTRYSSFGSERSASSFGSIKNISSSLRPTKGAGATGRSSILRPRPRLRKTQSGI